MWKTRQLGLFMTPSDEKIFCEAIRNALPNVYFLNIKPTPDGDIDKRIFSCVTDCYDSDRLFSIVNFDLVDKDDLVRRRENIQGYYHFSQIGLGQIQFLRSYVNKREDLEIGRLADSYDSEDEKENWKKTVYKILKKLGHKIHAYYFYQGEPGIDDKPQTRLVAYEGAIRQYNGKNGLMVDGGAIYIAKDDFNNLEHKKLSIFS